jgi:hypothetical protein
MWPWWYTIVAINIVQVAAGIYYYRQTLQAPDARSAYVKSMRIMGLLFVLIACYRSVFVSRYLYQYAWFETLFNSSLLIRILAWCAEICFSCLIAFAMLRFNKDLPDTRRSSHSIARFIRYRSPFVLIICIFLAQFFATTGLITKSRMAFAIEETLWGIGFFSILPLAYIQYRRVFNTSNTLKPTRLSMLKVFASVNIAWCVIYCTYSLVYHLPTEYWVTAFEQIRTGIPEIKSGFSAVAEAFSKVNVTHDYEDWGFGFIFWHSSYFTVCVWIALFLMRAPRLKP